MVNFGEFLKNSNETFLVIFKHCECVRLRIMNIFFKEVENVF